jgi:hypothetical protein
MQHVERDHLEKIVFLRLWQWYGERRLHLVNTAGARSI